MGVGTNIKRILAEKKMTIKDLNEISGISINTLYSITKRDSSNVSSSVLTSIAQALDVSTFDLTVDSEQLRREVNSLEQIESAYSKDVAESLSKYLSMEPEHQKEVDKYIEYIFDTNGYYEKLQSEGEKNNG